MGTTTCQHDDIFGYIKLLLKFFLEISETLQKYIISEKRYSCECAAFACFGRVLEEC